MALISRASVLCLCAVATIGCQKSPTGPGTGPPAGPTITSLEIIGPATVAPGASPQFRVAATWSDHVAREVSNVTWTSGNPAVLTIDPSGVAVAHAPGRTHVHASTGGRAALAKPVLVLERGTFWLSGSVADGRYAVEAAVVEAVSAGSRTATRTDIQGNFNLYGVPDDTILRVSKDGYLPHEQHLTLTDHGTLRVTLQLARERLQLAGTYRLTLATGGCSEPSSIAEELRQRTYTAVVTQNADLVTVQLAGSDFLTRTGYTANSFFGVVTPSDVAFVFWPGDVIDDPAVVERLSDGTFLTITGRALATVTDTGLAASLDGSFLHHADSSFSRLIGSCTSKTHTLTLTRS